MPSTGAAALTAVAAACAPTPAPAPVAKPTDAPAPAAAAPPTPLAASSSETVYVFNVGSKDVTLIDAAARQARETRPLGAAVRWLSNEQTYWDGQLVWTYDFPENKLQAIGIDPRGGAGTKTVPELGTGPGHSLMLPPDK